jgi:hypothetical protein
MPAAMANQRPTDAALRAHADPPPQHEDYVISRLRRELIVLALALLCGLVLMPFLVWFVGNRVLGPYTHGQNAHAGPFALLEDFFVGLWHGSALFWVMALGPLLLLLLVRAFVFLVRAIPAAKRA